MLFNTTQYLFQYIPMLVCILFLYEKWFLDNTLNKALKKRSSLLVRTVLPKIVTVTLFSERLQDPTESTGRESLLQTLAQTITQII